MAVVKAPALSIDASGNLGAICYSKWRGLSIARDVWTGTVPNTTKQQVIQGYMTTASQAWSGTLTAAERDKWRAAARDQVRLSRVKTSYIPTGYQYFMQLNIQVLRQALGLKTVPPGKIKPYGFAKIAGYHEASGAWVVWYRSEPFTTVPPTHQCELWVAGPFDTGGRNPREQEYKFIRYFPLNSTGWVSNPVNHKYYWGRIRWVESSGRVGNWFVKQIYISY